MKTQNRIPLRRLLLIFGATILVQILSVSLLLLPQADGGYFESQLVCTEARHFDTLVSAVTPDTEVRFIDGGYLVPVFLNDSPYALALFGDGSIVRDGTEDLLSECILVLSEEDYSAMMGAMELQTSSENTLRLKAQLMLEDLTAQSPIIYSLIGPRYFRLPTGNPVLILTDGPQPQALSSGSLSFLQNANFLLSALSLALQYAALFGLILVITNSRQEQRTTYYPSLRKSLAETRLPVLGLVAGGLALPYLMDNLYVTAAYNIFALGVTFYLVFFKSGVRSADISFDFRNYLRSLPAALICGLLLYTGITLSMPQSALDSSAWAETVLKILPAVFWLCFFMFSWLRYELNSRFSGKYTYRIMATSVVLVLGGGFYLSGLSPEMIAVNAIFFGLLNYAVLALLAVRSRHSWIPASAWGVALLMHQLLIL